MRFGLSMLYSNFGANQKCFDEAMRAVALYRESGEERGLARALSQVASRYALARSGDEAKRAAGEALLLARRIGEPRLLADALRRCAAAYEADGDDAVRERFAESVAIFRSLGRDDDTARALQWWGQWEADQAGDFRSAVEHMLESMELDSRHAVVMFSASDVAGYYLAIGDCARAELYARQALTLAAKARHRIIAAMSISYLSAIAVQRDARRSARLIGYADGELRRLDWQRVAYEQRIVEGLYGALAAALSRSEFDELLAQGAALSDTQALAAALAG